MGFSFPPLKGMTVDAQTAQPVFLEDPKEFVD
jgi:hypothetical protein